MRIAGLEASYAVEYKGRLLEALSPLRAVADEGKDCSVVVGVRVRPFSERLGVPEDAHYSIPRSTTVPQLWRSHTLPGRACSETQLDVLLVLAVVWSSLTLDAAAYYHRHSKPSNPTYCLHACL